LPDCLGIARRFLGLSEGGEDFSRAAVTLDGISEPLASSRNCDWVIGIGALFFSF